MAPEMTENPVIEAAIIRYSQFPEAALVLADCDPRLVFLHDPRGATAEQYRRIASRIVSRYPSGTLMVTSPAPKGGKTLTAINLAFSLAERSPTLLVDLDTRHSSVRVKLGITPAAPTIEDALAETAPAEDCVTSLALTRLCVAFNRGQSQSIVELMGEGRPRRFLDWASQKFTWVVLDTPPAFPTADTLEIAQHADIGMLVIRSRSTPARLARQTMDALKGRLHFVLLNGAEAPSYSAYEKYYHLDESRESRSSR